MTYRSPLKGCPAVSDAEYQERLKSKVIVDPRTGCWLFQGFLHPKAGYGEFCYRGKKMRAHRAAYIIFKGPIPDGFDVCHSCDVRRCLNPDHLWAGTNEQNLHDASDKGRHHCQLKTHCPKGHPYDEQNTLVIRTKSYTGVGRQCRTCTLERTRSPEYRAKARERARLKRQRTRLVVSPGSQRSDQS